MFSKLTPRVKGVTGVSRIGGITYAILPRLNGQSVYAIDGRTGFQAATSYAANNNVVDVSDFFVGQGSNGQAFLAQRANSALNIWTNNTSRGIVSAGGGWTLNTPDSFATVSTLTVNGGFGNGGLPVLQVNNSSTNQQTISASCSATSAAQSAYFFGVSGSSNGLNINGDGSFNLGFPTAGGGGMFEGSTGTGFGWRVGATDLMALATNGGLTLNTGVLLAALANQMNCNGYQVVGWPAGSKSVAASAAINTTETYVTAAYVANGGAAAAAGQAWKITAYGTCTSTAANVSTFTPRVGTNGTTADTALTTLTCTAAASGTTISFIYEAWVIFRTTGVSGTVWSFARLTNNGVTGISATQTVLNTGASTTVNTSGTLHVGMSYKSAATTTTSTFQSTQVDRLF